MKWSSSSKILRIKSIISTNEGWEGSYTFIDVKPQFVENLLLEKLIGPGLTAQELNCHKPEWVLDELYAADVELAFGVLVAHVCSNEQLNQLTQSLDTTRLTLTGEYEQNSDTDTVAIIHGFSQYHRLDLKQATAELVLAQDGGIPLAMLAATPCLKSGPGMWSKDFNKVPAHRYWPPTPSFTVGITPAI